MSELLETTGFVSSLALCPTTGTKKPRPVSIVSKESNIRARLAGTGAPVI